MQKAFSGHLPLVWFLGLALSFSPACASLLVYEGFDYGIGSIAGQNGGSGFSGAWSNVTGSGGIASITSPGSSYSSLDSEGNKLFLNPATSTSNVFVSRSFSSSFTDDSGGSIWISALAQITNAGERSFLLRFFSGSTEVFDLGSFGASSSGGTPQWTAGKQAAPDVGNAWNFSFLVVRIDWNPSGNETVSFYLNPSPGSSAPSTPTFTTSLEIGGFDSLSPFAGSASGGLTTSSGTIDEFRIGTTFADVAPIPEPSSLALCGILLSALPLLRQFKRLCPRI